LATVAAAAATSRFYVNVLSVSCSAAMVVSSPWPVRTTVSAGRVSSFPLMEAKMVG
jgi:hypothetical protein